MKKSLKILIILTLFLCCGRAGLAQSGSIQKDSLAVNLKKTDANEKRQKTGESVKTQAGKTGNNAGSIKQVKSARPDMSRARGARPPDIVRPAGSRIPRGVGRPAGAGRPGRR